MQGVKRVNDADALDSLALLPPHEGGCAAESGREEEEEEQEEQSRGDTEGPGGAELQHQNSYRECK